eukprot:9612104-Lingulodinium_polyedra.AAC.1
MVRSGPQKRTVAKQLAIVGQQTRRARHHTRSGGGEVRRSIELGQFKQLRGERDTNDVKPISGKFNAVPRPSVFCMK